jgi:hypothetical protein
MRKAKEAAAEANALLDQSINASLPSEKEAFENQVWEVIKSYLGECIVELQAQAKARNVHSNESTIAVFREFEQRWLAFLNRLTGKVNPKFQEEIKDEFKSGVAFVFGLDIAKFVWPQWQPSATDITRSAEAAAKSSPWSGSR